MVSCLVECLLVAYGHNCAISIATDFTRFEVELSGHNGRVGGVFAILDKHGYAIIAGRVRRGVTPGRCGLVVAGQRGVSKPSRSGGIRPGSDGLRENGQKCWSERCPRQDSNLRHRLLQPGNLNDCRYVAIAVAGQRHSCAQRSC